MFNSTPETPDEPPYPYGMIVDGLASANNDWINLFFADEGPPLDPTDPQFDHPDWGPWLSMSTAPSGVQPYLATLTTEMHYDDGTHFDNFDLHEDLEPLGSIQLAGHDLYDYHVKFSILYYESKYNVIVKATITDWTLTLLVTPTDFIFDLINTTEEINAQSGILNSLDEKLDSAVKALDDVHENNDLSAVNKLQAFINAVEAKRCNQISEDDADSLRAAAQEIIDMLNGQ